MTPHIFVLGPSGAGKSSIASGVAKCRGYLHLELDGTSWTPARNRPSLASRIRTRLEAGLSIRGAEFEAVSFGALGRPWRNFLFGDASPLSDELRRRSRNVDAAACIVSFPSGVVLTAEQIAVADAAGIAVRILYGSRDDCVRAFLMREAASHRRLDREHWLLYNRQTHDTFGAPEFAQYRVVTFGNNGSRPPIELLADAICGC